MGVFKDDQIVARVLGGQAQTLKNNNSRKIAIAGCAAAILGLAAWAVIARKGAGAPNASSAAVPAAVVDTTHKTDAGSAVFSPAVTKTSASTGVASGDKKRLPPVIDDVPAEAVELNPKGAVRSVEVHSEPQGRDKFAGAAKNADLSIDAGENYEQAKKLEEDAKGNSAQLERARALFQKALDSGHLPTPLETNCLSKLNELTARLILDSKSACTEPKAEFHKVESGEVVEKIARKFKVTQGQIKRINHLNDKLSVRVGQNLKMLQGETVYKVDTDKLTGTLYIDGVFIKRFPVGIGPGNATPKGTYLVENKLINPDWYYDGKKVPFGDPKNILGSRWMGMANSATGSNGAGLGVHGTALPDSVPGRESKGCVRMHNEDIEELYDFMPQGGKVVIE